MKCNPAFTHALLKYDGRYFVKNPKILLLCDMDETLLTEASGKIYLRPGIRIFLRNLTKFFELFLVTFSVRSRVLTLLRNDLDPKRRLFGDRVLCREDITSYTNKFRCVRDHFKSAEVDVNIWNYVLVIDDTPSMWTGTKSILPIRPFRIPDDYKGPLKDMTIFNEHSYILELKNLLISLHKCFFPQDPKIKKIETVPKMLVQLRRDIGSYIQFQGFCYQNPSGLCKFPTLKCNDPKAKAPVKNQAKPETEEDISESDISKEEVNPIKHNFVIDENETNFLVNKYFEKMTKVMNN